MSLTNENKYFDEDKMRGLGVPEYQISAFRKLFNRVDLKGKRVLEVGGSALPPKIVFDQFQAESWTCVDNLQGGSYQIANFSEHYKSVGVKSLSESVAFDSGERYQIFDGNIEKAASLPDEYYDQIVSITSFEHILAMPQALAQMKRVLNQEGMIFSYHGPVWSSYCGHHCWVTEELNFNQCDVIPDFAHLLMTPSELYRVARKKFSVEISQNLINQVYNEPRINRLFYEDYIEFFRMAGFSYIDVKPYGKRAVPNNIAGQLALKYPNKRNFDAYGMYCYLCK
jgi:hypothetical protein